MCEQAAEAHRSKGTVQSGRRGRKSSDGGRTGKSAIDSILSNSISAQSSQNTEKPSKIFLINCLCAIQQPILKYEAAAQYAKNLGSVIDTHLQALVEKEVDMILSKCGLLRKMPMFRNSLNSNVTNSPPLAETEETSPASLAECLKSLFGLILGSDSALPEFEQLQVPKLRSEACLGVAKSLSEAYELIYAAIMDPENKYKDPKALARHPPDQIRTILGI